MKRTRQYLSQLLHDSRTLGIMLILCTLISLILTNSPFGSEYSSLWETNIHIPGPLHLPHTFLHWINDGLMTFFFFLVGMEIKRELMDGELREIRTAILPVFAAIGGMIIPAALYIFFNKNGDYENGWGIPMATDIAFSLGIASILDKRVPVALKIFLTALAIIDDLGAIVMIALFYGEAIQWWAFGSAVLAVLLIYLATGRKMPFLVRLIPAMGLWYFIFNSGIHATVAGVIFAFLIPLNQIPSLENRLHKPVNFIILPLFALANTAILLQGSIFEAMHHPINYGIMAGLVIGKPLGIVTFCYLMVLLRWGKLPVGVGWNKMVGVGMLAGIGFTMSIFISVLAFKDPGQQNIAKISVLIASLVSVILGSIVLIWVGQSPREPR